MIHSGKFHWAIQQFSTVIILETQQFSGFKFGFNLFIILTFELSTLKLYSAIQNSNSAI